MLVSVDADKGTVTVYGATVVTVPITQHHKLIGMLRGKTVQYISDVVEVSGQEVLSMIEDLANSGEINMSASAAEIGDGRLWMRATGSGQLYLPLTNKLKLNFQHPGDFISLDKLGYDVADRFAVVKALLDRGKLEIVNTVKMNRIKSKVAERIAEREDKLFGNLIVDTSVKGKDRSTLAKELAARRPGRDEQVIDMDDYRGPSDDLEGLSDEQRIALQQGWGKDENAEDEGDGEGTA